MAVGGELQEDGAAEFFADAGEAAFDRAVGRALRGGDFGERETLIVACLDEEAGGGVEFCEGVFQGGVPDGFGVCDGGGCVFGKEGGDAVEEGAVAAGAAAGIGGGGACGAGEPCPEGGFVRKGPEVAEGPEEGGLHGIGGGGFIAAGDDEGVAGEAFAITVMEFAHGGLVAAPHGGGEQGNGPAIA